MDQARKGRCGIIGDEPEFPHWAQSSLATFFQLGRSTVPGTVLRCGDRRFYRRPDSRKADKLRHQCSFNLGDRALGRYCETRQWHEPSRQQSLSVPVSDNLRLPAFGPQVPKMRKKHDGAMES